MWRYVIECCLVTIWSFSVLDALSAEGNWSLESVRQLWERCKPRGLVTIHRCGTLTSWRWQPSRAKVCVRTRASITRTCECVRLCVSPGLKTEICQWPQRLSAYLGFLQIPNNQWQDRREKEAYEREREGFLPKLSTLERAQVQYFTR